MAKEHGGWVESMAEERVVLRVPDDQLDAMLDELPKLGEVARRRVNAVDVARRTAICGCASTACAGRAIVPGAPRSRAERDDAAAVEKEIERVTAPASSRARGAARGDGQAHSVLGRWRSTSRAKRGGSGRWVFYALYSGVKWLLVWD